MESYSSKDSHPLLDEGVGISHDFAADFLTTEEVLEGDAFVVSRQHVQRHVMRRQERKARNLRSRFALHQQTEGGVET